MLDITIENVRLSDYAYGYKMQEIKTNDKGEAYYREASFYPTLSMAVKYARKLLRTNDETIIATLEDFRNADDEFLIKLKKALAGGCYAE